jgi:hypothetical protein
MADTGNLEVTDCTCKNDYTKVEDLSDASIFQCALKDQCTQSGSCPANAECFSNFETGSPT